MRFLAFLAVVLLAPTVSAAQDADPVAVEAVAAARAEDWALASSLVDPADALTKDIVTYLWLRTQEAPFEDYAAFIQRRADWPGMDRVRAAGEEKMPAGLPPQEVVDWFGAFVPDTGEGAVRLAEALIALGQTEKAQAMLVDIWKTYRLSDTGHAAMAAAFPKFLARYHLARTDQLLWAWRTTEAERMLDLLDPDHAALARARIAYIRKQSDIAALAAAVPETLKDDAGLDYDRFNWLADRGERTEAVTILKARSTSVAALGDPFRWSGWRRSLARWEMREGRVQSAYELAANHFLTEGSAFADLEWIAGYVALTYLEKPQLALSHFQTADATVDSPISEGRMQYWIGRTFDVLGDPVAANAAYAIAAQHQTGFYGLLAAEHLGMSLDPALTGANDPTDWAEAPFMQADLTRAALLLLQGGERGRAVSFFAELGKTLDAKELSQLGALLSEMGEPYYEVLLGKTAITRGILVPSIYFPLHALKDADLPVPAALALSIARRESEFNAGVGSPAGALGLMQLMPATAEEVSRQIGEPYSRNRLTADPSYNARLGATYLRSLADEFGYSPVMMAAAYNAGPSRPKSWMDERGDPRIGEADVVDWIEHIPFRETRNYVMRVTESIPVYEARLTGETGPIRFMELLTGEKPLVRPRPRPEIVLLAPDVAQEVPQTPVALSGSSPASSPRPIGRPEG
ncbi:MAG: lytic transglycosylase domain-containing protein [Yoonia sp.]|nr:lytic transglycosylase domain-containing protein [Yoonia sp.]